ncbi:MAG: ATP-binding protein [Cyanobacteria bacterium P01_F01_bin.86]
MLATQYPLSQSPFIVGPPITQPRQFFGRERILRRLFRFLKTHPLQNAAIIGQRRAGKTSLLQYIQAIPGALPTTLRSGQKYDWLPNPEVYRWVYVDFQDSGLHSREGLLRYLLQAMELAVPGVCTLASFMEQVRDRLHRPTVVLMDEIGVGLQRCPELDDDFWECLRSWATTRANGNLAFVLATPESPLVLARQTGHSSPFFNIFGYTTTLGPFTDSEAREFLTSAPIPLAAEDMAWMLHHSQGWPILLQVCCRERLFYLEDGDSGDGWHQDALEQMRPYTHLLEPL